MRTPPSLSVPELDNDVVAEGRLSGVTEWFWYIVAAVSYIAFGIWNRWLLNWLLGPIWLVAVICLGPPMADWLRVQIVDRLIGGRR